MSGDCSAYPPPERLTTAVPTGKAEPNMPTRYAGCRCMPNPGLPAEAPVNEERLGCSRQRHRPRSAVAIARMRVYGRPSPQPRRLRARAEWADSGAPMGPDEVNAWRGVSLAMRSRVLHRGRGTNRLTTSGEASDTLTGPARALPRRDGVPRARPRRCWPASSSSSSDIAVCPCGPPSGARARAGRRAARDPSA